MNILKAVNLIFRYKVYSPGQKEESYQSALEGIDLTINPGDFVGILGRNGSGKSTLAKQLAGLLTPTEGYVYIDGLDSQDSRNTFSIRNKVGMVFQNPDNQIVGNTVEEDVAFGPENLGVPQEELSGRVEKALSMVSMHGFQYDSPGRLSGGQKQKIAIAGILAMEPKCIILDEPTAMLDPQGRKEVLEAVRYLNQEKKITIILITHRMEEVEEAHSIYVMKEGKIAVHGSPEDIWGKPDQLEECGIRLPFTLRLADHLRKRGIPVPRLYSEQELLDFLENQMAEKRYQGLKRLSELTEFTLPEISEKEASEEPDFHKEVNRYETVSEQTGDGGQLSCRHLSYSYSNLKVGKATDALQDISFSMKKGDYVAVVGKTGSGKSTLLQHLNGLLKPDRGHCFYDGKDIHGTGISLKEVRQKVALCFQYPEYQLFEETVLKDICFGPSNMGCTKWVCLKRARDAMELLGLPEQMESLSPLVLSGGQKRKVALAGILAMDPEYLVLDEPAAGMDQPGKDNLFHLLRELNEDKKTGILLVSHDMDDVAEYANRIIVMDHGKIVMDGGPGEVFAKGDKLKELGLDMPRALSFYHRLRESDFGTESSMIPVTVAKLADYISHVLDSTSQEI